MSRSCGTQKLISFVDTPLERERITAEMKNGWSIVSLMQNGSYYIGIMEKTPDYSLIPDEEKVVYLPPKKKIKISC